MLLNMETNQQTNQKVVEIELFFVLYRNIHLSYYSYT